MGRYRAALKYFLRNTVSEIRFSKLKITACASGGLNIVKDEEVTEEESMNEEVQDSPIDFANEVSGAVMCNHIQLQQKSPNDSLWYKEVANLRREDIHISSQYQQNMATFFPDQTMSAHHGDGSRSMTSYQHSLPQSHNHTHSNLQVINQSTGLTDNILYMGVKSSQGISIYV